MWFLSKQRCKNHIFLPDHISDVGSTVCSNNQTRTLWNSKIRLVKNKYEIIFKHYSCKIKGSQILQDLCKKNANFFENRGYPTMGSANKIGGQKKPPIFYQVLKSQLRRFKQIPGSPSVKWLGPKFWSLPLRAAAWRSSYWRGERIYEWPKAAKQQHAVGDSKTWVLITLLRRYSIFAWIYEVESQFSDNFSKYFWALEWHLVQF